jgi:hypothetical protein
VEAIDDARDIRWTIRDELDGSRDMRQLLRDADRVLAALRDVDDRILNEASLRSIHEAVDVAHDRLQYLDRSLGRCDFAVVHPE